MRGPLLEIPAFGRAAGFALVAAAIIATAAHFDRREAQPKLITTPSGSSADPLATELARCNRSG